jgi:hypothetical protein
MSENFDTLITHAKSLTGLTPELEACLKEIAPAIIPHLPKVTDAFYIRLITTPSTSKFLENYTDKLAHLKITHLKWLTGLFTLDVDADFARNMAKVGDIHVAIQLPLDFMAGSMALINKGLIQIIFEEFSDDKQRCLRALQAVVAITGLALVIMQQSYQLWD